MISRGADCVIIDNYRSTAEDQTTMKVRDEAAQHPNFEFAVMEDKENYRNAPDPEARAQKIVADAAHINSTYFSNTF